MNLRQRESSTLSVSLTPGAALPQAPRHFMATAGVPPFPRFAYPDCFSGPTARPGFRNCFPVSGPGDLLPGVWREADARAKSVRGRNRLTRMWGGGGRRRSLLYLTLRV